MARRKRKGEETALPDTRVTAKARYEQLVPGRDPYLLRARDGAVLTIPSLMPPEGTTGTTNLPTPFQSLGADAVNNISAKLLLSLFPPGNPFYRLAVDDFVLEALKEKAGGEGQDFDDARAEFETALGKIERAVMNRMEQKGARTVLFEALKHDVVCGNALLQVLKGGKLKMFPLDRYVVKRDGEGTVLEIVAKEVLSRMTLPPEIAALVQRSEMAKQDKDTAQKDKDAIDVFYHVKLEGGQYAVYQEVVEQRVPGSDGTYPLDNSAWIALRWTAIPNEDYGRGLVEEYIGDLNSLEGLSQSIVEFAAAASKILFMVDDTGITDRRQVARAQSGEFVDGKADDVTILQLEKTADFQVANAVADRLEKRLERAFLLLSGVQRDAERVTAEEIRTIVAELEAKLGGAYSVLAQDLQLPLAKRYMLEMQKSGDLPHLPKDSVEPSIITGLDGLGRTSDLQKLDALVEGVAQTFGPEAVAEYFNVGAYLTRKGAALGINITGLVRSEQEVQESRQAAAQQQMREKLGPAAIKAATDVAKARGEQAGAAAPPIQQ